jgi:hypothetical protein
MGIMGSILSHVLTLHMIKAIISIAINFANEAIDVGIVIDGPVHDASKHASMK